MLKIGEFAVLSSISIYMLRNYDKIGLLTPSTIDKLNGYRYYSEEQLIIANRIQALKAMGFGLSDIIKIQSQEAEDDRFTKHLERKLAETQKEIRLLLRQQQLLENSLKATKTKQEYKCTIAVKTIPPMTVVCCRDKIDDFPDEGVLWNKLMNECQLQKIQFSHPHYAVSIQHEINFEDKYIDVEVRRAVDKKGEDTDTIFFSPMPQMVVASLIFQGGYSKIQDVNQYVAQWILENNFEISGPAFSIYHISPDNESNEEKFITEFCLPILHRK